VKTTNVLSVIPSQNQADPSAGMRLASCVSQDPDVVRCLCRTRNLKGKGKGEGNQFLQSYGICQRYKQSLQMAKLTHDHQKRKVRTMQLGDRVPKKHSECRPSRTRPLPAIVEMYRRRYPGKRDLPPSGLSWWFTQDEIHLRSGRRALATRISEAEVFLSDCRTVSHAHSPEPRTDAA
jgi:hypothetical protein